MYQYGDNSTGYDLTVSISSKAIVGKLTSDKVFFGASDTALFTF